MLCAFVRLFRRLVDDRHLRLVNLGVAALLGGLGVLVMMSAL
jgi:hypothetical protein